MRQRTFISERLDLAHLTVVPAPSGKGRMWMVERYRGALEEAGLGDFESVMSSSAGRLLRTLPDRQNWRLEITSAASGTRGMYLKKHRTSAWRLWFSARLPGRPGKTAGCTEARNAIRLAELGIGTIPLVAFGERRHTSGLAESFVLTEELAGYTQLDHFLRESFPPVSAGRDGRLRRLINHVADVTARFHRLGFNHRDLYCCHFFVREQPRGRFQVNLIDLQRVEHRRWLRRRWLVKDLAQLAYSAPRDRISCTARMAFIKHYLGVAKLRPSDKRLVRSVLARQQAMEHRLGTHP